HVNGVQTCALPTSWPSARQPTSTIPNPFTGDRSTPYRENKNGTRSTSLPNGPAGSSCPNTGCPRKPNGNTRPKPLWEAGNTTITEVEKNIHGKGIIPVTDNVWAVGTSWQTLSRARGITAG